MPRVRACTLGMDMTEQEVSLVMDELDSDGSSTIGIDEFMEEMRKIHCRRKKEEEKSRANSSMACPEAMVI
eukprot:COSAG01_NODE_1202_length_11263_cov_64.078466_6_plen_71_part_00